jgi:hypothetical protein
VELVQVQLLKRHKQQTTMKGQPMTETPDAAMLMSMVRDSRAGFVDPKWDELLALVNDQANAIQRVRAVHISRTRDDVSFCIACVDHDKIGYFQSWPCDTTRALDGEQE